MKPTLHCLLACLSFALVACHSRPVDRPATEASRLEPARPPLAGAAAATAYFGEEYVQEQRALATRPDEQAAPTF
jgi:hypothetical protein